jgi:hypothetical protein
MTTANDNNGHAPVAPKGFFGVLGDILKNSNDRRPAPRRGGGGTGRPQPKKPCGGCGGK